MAESSGYAHNKIGAYLDDGSINKVDSFGEEKSDLKPQVFTNKVIIDTFNWTKVEGSFTATGTEKYISIGNFFPNDSVTTIATDYRKFLPQYSYYLIDDVSVIPIDLDADAGTDSHAEPGKSVPIGRVGDTTALGLDCKWYYKGALIDSGAIISVKGSAIVGTVDTYVVVQTVCGLVKNDTVTVKTVPVGIKEWSTNNTFSVFPNPSNGVFTISSTAVIPNLPAGQAGGTKWSEPASPAGRGTLHATVYDVLGRIVVQHQMITFSNNTATLNIQAAPECTCSNLQMRPGTPIINESLSNSRFTYREAGVNSQRSHASFPAQREDQKERDNEAYAWLQRLATYAAAPSRFAQHKI